MNQSGQVDSAHIGWRNEGIGKIGDAGLRLMKVPLFFPFRFDGHARICIDVRFHDLAIGIDCLDLPDDFPVLLF